MGQPLPITAARNASPETLPAALLPAALLAAGDLQALIDALRADGFTVFGPRLRDSAVVYDRLEAAGQLPAGWADVQEPGTYRVERSGDGAFFGYTVGAQSWKRFLFPPERRLWRAERTDDGTFAVVEEPIEAPRQAFLGVRPCELAAIAVQDRVFLGGPYVDPAYAARRGAAFIVAVSCTRAGATCFCASMGTGPQAAPGFDLAMTELLDGDRHAFLVEAGTEAGAALLARLPAQPAAEADVAEARARVARAAAAQVRHLDTSDVHDLLLGDLEHPAWDAVAERCLACANCTLVCPTCFCHDVEDATSLDGRTAERRQTWGSCFTLDFSYIHGGAVRPSTRARYRQWLTHKLANWQDQFGTLGCVGCGRCIAWCPVGIDLTEVVASFRAGDAAAGDGAGPTAGPAAPDPAPSP